MSANIVITRTHVCYVCHGTGTIAHTIMPCWMCVKGHMSASDYQTWNSYARCVTDHDPFQNGAHTTMCAWYVQRVITRWESNRDVTDLDLPEWSGSVEMDSDSGSYY